MLLQVLRLTQDQISQLPPAERDAILALVGPPYEYGWRYWPHLYKRSQLGNLAWLNGAIVDVCFYILRRAPYPVIFCIPVDVMNKTRINSLTGTFIRSSGYSSNYYAWRWVWKWGKCLKTQYSTMLCCSWDFVVLGISAYSIHHCVPELVLLKIGEGLMI